jgi:hypothetical protein
MTFKTRIVAATAFLFLPSMVTAQAAPAGNACSLLTTDQVSAALGSTVKQGKALTPKLCMWDAAAPAKSGGTPRIALTISSAQAFVYAKMPVPDSKITKTPVSGLGDEAVYGTTAGQMASVNVKKGSSYFSVGVNSVPMDKAQALVTQLAKEAMAKL